MASDGHLFGGGIADFVITTNTSGELVLAAGADVWFYNAQVGGTRYDGDHFLTDPLTGDDLHGVVTSDSFGGIPVLRGPSNVRYMWSDANSGSGPRYLMQAADRGDDLDGMLPRSGGTMTGELRLDDDSPAVSKDYVDSHAGGAPLILPFSFGGILSPVVGTSRLYNPTSRSLTIGKVWIQAAVGPVGQALIVDVNKNGTTIYTTQANRPKINDGSTVGNSPAADITSWGPDEYLTVDIDQVGTTTPATGLTLSLAAT